MPLYTHIHIPIQTYRVRASEQTNAIWNREYNAIVCARVQAGINIHACLTTEWEIARALCVRESSIPYGRFYLCCFFFLFLSICLSISFCWLLTVSDKNRTNETKNYYKRNVHRKYSKLMASQTIMRTYRHLNDTLRVFYRLLMIPN